MALRFTPAAFRDIEQIEDYLSDRSSEGLANVLASLKRTFAHIATNARYGRPTRRQGVRLAVEPRYKYLIPYHVKESDIWILRVYHGRRMPLDFATMELPET